LNNDLARGTAATSRTGIGQRYQSFLEEFADNIVVGEGRNRKTLKTKDLLTNIAKALGETGATQKVDTIKQLKDQLSIISDKYSDKQNITKEVNQAQRKQVSDQPSVISDKNSKTKNMTKEINQIQSLTQKFNKGGLASRR